jgi:hypothetical protein
VHRWLAGSAFRPRGADFGTRPIRTEAFLLIDPGYLFGDHRAARKERFTSLGFLAALLGRQRRDRVTRDFRDWLAGRTGKGDSGYSSFPPW